ncbi:unnamed protein product [Ectocarpus sp. 8 AP-2014]
MTQDGLDTPNSVPRPVMVGDGRGRPAYGGVETGDKQARNMLPEQSGGG